MPPFEVKFEAVIAAAASLEAKTPICLLPAPKHDADVFEVVDGVDRALRAMAIREQVPLAVDTGWSRRRRARCCLASFRAAVPNAFRAAPR